MKVRKKWRLPLTLLGVSVSILGIVGISGFYIDIDANTNQTVVGGTNITILEEYDPLEEILPGDEIIKKVQVKNQGPDDCYVRARVLFSVGEAERYYKTDYNTTLWETGQDGYYYYKKVLKSGEVSEPLFQTLYVSSDTPAGLLHDLELYVYGEACQSNGSDGYTEAWDILAENKTGGSTK